MMARMFPEFPLILWNVILTALTPVFAKAQTAPYPRSSVLSSATFDFSTHVRLAPGATTGP